MCNIVSSASFFWSWKGFLSRCKNLAMNFRQKSTATEGMDGAGVIAVLAFGRSVELCTSFALSGFIARVLVSYKCHFHQLKFARTPLSWNTSWETKCRKFWRTCTRTGRRKDPAEFAVQKRRDEAETTKLFDTGHKLHLSQLNVRTFVCACMLILKKMCARISFLAIWLLDVSFSNQLNYSALKWILIPPKLCILSLHNWILTKQHWNKGCSFNDASQIRTAKCEAALNLHKKYGF